MSESTSRGVDWGWIGRVTSLGNPPAEEEEEEQEDQAAEEAPPAAYALRANDLLDLIGVVLVGGIRRVAGLRGTRSRSWHDWAAHRVQLRDCQVVAVEVRGCECTLSE